VAAARGALGASDTASERTTWIILRKHQMPSVDVIRTRDVQNNHYQTTILISTPVQHDPRSISCGQDEFIQPGQPQLTICSRRSGLYVQDTFHVLPVVAISGCAGTELFHDTSIGQHLPPAFDAGQVSRVFVNARPARCSTATRIQTAFTDRSSRTFATVCGLQSGLQGGRRPVAERCSMTRVHVHPYAWSPKIHRSTSGNQPTVLTISPRDERPRQSIPAAAAKISPFPWPTRRYFAAAHPAANVIHWNASGSIGSR